VFGLLTIRILVLLVLTHQTALAFGVVGLYSLPLAGDPSASPVSPVWSGGCGSMVSSTES
jgi:hypothetical protein